jgi:hypothetical protein
MEFFNRKEEVLDIELTQYGKYLLSIGELKPAYYSFFDDDVIYDTQYQGDPPKSDHTGFSGPSENQKDSEDRIKETPRIKVQHNFRTVEKTSSQVADDIFYELKYFTPTAAEAFIYGVDPGETVLLPQNPFLYKFPYPKNLKDEMFGYALPLGTSKYNSVYAPAFEANFLKGNIVPNTSIYYDSGSFGIKRIPQVEIDVTFQTSIEQRKNNANNAIDVQDVTTYTDNNPTVTIGLNGPAGNPIISKIYENGNFVKVVEDYILLDLQELNSIVAKDGFELEVFEVENPDTASENLRKLKFTNFSDQNYVSPLVDLNLVGQSGQISNPSQVEYFFLARLDDEIEQILITQGFNQNLGASIMEPCEDDFDAEL